jgi:PleD family two-component response regulator
MVLVVDDHEDTCEMVARLLRLHGLKSRYVTDPTEALGVMREEPPEVVILDQTMPGVTGTELLTAMRADSVLARVPVIMYSAAFDHGLAQQALAMGASEWLIKGVHSPQYLLAAVDRARVV